jgi:hypothetical protein
MSSLLRFQAVCTIVVVCLPTIAHADRYAGAYSLAFPTIGALAVYDGKVYVINPVASADYMDWSLAIPKDGGTGPISLKTDGKWSDASLGINGETGEVLVSKGGDGKPLSASWKLTAIKDANSKYYVQMSGGKFKDWYLEAEEKGEERKNAEGQKMTLHQLKLTQTPSKRSIVAIDLVGP